MKNLPSNSTVLDFEFEVETVFARTEEHSSSRAVQSVFSIFVSDQLVLVMSSSLHLLFVISCTNSITSSHFGTCHSLAATRPVRLSRGIIESDD